MWLRTLAGLARHFLKRTKQAAMPRAITTMTATIMSMEESDAVAVDMALMELPVMKGRTVGVMRGGDGNEGWLGGKKGG